MTYFNNDSVGRESSPRGVLRSAYDRKWFYDQIGTSEEGADLGRKEMTSSLDIEHLSLL